MGRLRHRTAPGFTYFVTTKTWQNRSVFQVSRNAETLGECLLRYRDAGAYLLHEFVVMPNHLHLLMTPADDMSLEKAMQLIKGGSSHSIHQQAGHRMQIWQPGFHEESIRDALDFLQRAKYIHNNPVHARLVETPEDWPYGSASSAFKIDAPPNRLKSFYSGAEAQPPKIPSHSSKLHT
jgi:REP-associated tyrosine transposase